MEYDIDKVSQTDSEDNNSYTSYSSHNMYFNIKNQMKLEDNCTEEKSLFIDLLEQRNRVTFLGIFKNKKDSHIAYSMIKSNRFNRSLTKIKKNSETSRRLKLCFWSKKIKISSMKIK